MKTKGMFWHVHDDELVEYCYNYKERADYIKNKKPKNEIGIRLRLFSPVKGKLPVKFVKALEAYNRAGEAYEKAWEAYDRALEAYNRAGEACEKAREACKDKINTLHEKECPNCSWDGNEIGFN